MIYTFQITDGSPQSDSIINLLLSLSKDYDFLKISSTPENSDYELSTEQENELDRRYQNFINNPRNGKTWNEIEKL